MKQLIWDHSGEKCLFKKKFCEYARRSSQYQHQVCSLLTDGHKRNPLSKEFNPDHNRTDRVKICPWETVSETQK